MARPGRWKKLIKSQSINRGESSIKISIEIASPAVKVTQVNWIFDCNQISNKFVIGPRLHHLKCQTINHPKGTHKHAHVDRAQPFTHLLPSVPIRFVITERWFQFPLFALEILIFCVWFSYEKTFWVEPRDEKMKEERKITKNSLNGPMIIICIICSHSMFQETSWSISWPQFVYLKWQEAVREKL